MWVGLFVVVRSETKWRVGEISGVMVRCRVRDEDFWRCTEVHDGDESGFCTGRVGGFLG